MLYNVQVYEPCLFRTIKLPTALIDMAYTPCCKSVKIMGKYHYQTTPKRKRCKTKCKYANIFVGSVECRDLCKNHKGYGKDENGKYVECAACE